METITSRKRGLISSEKPAFRRIEIPQVSNKQTGFVATACAAGCFFVETICYPFTTVKVRLQTNKEQFIPFFKAAKTYYKQEGPRTFFKGYTGTVPCCFLYNFVWFFLYEKCNLMQINALNQYDVEPDQIDLAKRVIPFVSGALAEVAAMCVYVPFNIPKLRMQIDNPKYYYRNLFDGVAQVYRTEGLSKFYRTSQLQVSSHVFYCGLLMAIYENLRKNVLDKKEEKKLTIRETLTCTILTSTFCGLTMNPFEVIINRFVNHSSKSDRVTVTGLVKELVKHEGLRGFYKGVPGKLIYGLAHSCVYMPIFEFLRSNYGVKLH